MARVALVARETRKGAARPHADRRSGRLRRQLVEELERGGALLSPAVREAFLAVPRECFVADQAAREGLEAGYRNDVILTARDERGQPTSSSSQPSMMAAMLEQLDLDEGQRVLEVGAGTGYNAALLAELVGPEGSVVSVELEPATARGARRALAQHGSPVKVVVGDGRDGWRRASPYDRIVVTASAAWIPNAWFDQLADGGLLELPLRIGRSGQAQAVVTFRKERRRLRSVAVLWGGFMALRDAAGDPAPQSAPSLSAGERVDGRGRPLAHLSGAALRSLSAERRRRLLRLALAESRIRQLGVRAPRQAMSLYLAIEAPHDRWVAGEPRTGVISRHWDGLALLAGAKTFTRIESYGDPDAERLLLDLVEDWRRHGRAPVRDLTLQASFWPGRRSSTAGAGSGRRGPEVAGGTVQRRSCGSRRRPRRAAGAEVPSRRRGRGAAASLLLA
ncbi:MAG TPA: methyltransferase domain-containing protein, partial [Solirubrobacteraceae bacterium]|nr:methyltransferase domain-containing protein [Solirubrobacteraceae bacterium]